MSRGVSKRLRFEVFKRDSFKCQYCGAAAPDVLLHVDHIDPRAAGGPDDIVNLITACVACNLGKGAVPLSDNSALAKSRQQIEELNARREQLDMMLQWRRELQSLQSDTVTRIAEYWSERTPGLALNEAGIASLAKLLRRYSVEEVLHAMDVAGDQYVEKDGSGRATAESFEVAFGKLGGICRVERASKNDPDLKKLYYIRGILRNRLSYCDDHRALELMRIARSWDVSLDELDAIAVRVSTWTQFRDTIGDAIDRQMELLGDDDEEAVG